MRWREFHPAWLGFCLFLFMSDTVYSAAQFKFGAKPSGVTLVLKNIVTCMKTGVNRNAIQACAKAYLSKDLKGDDQDRMLAWLSYPYSISEPKPCEEKDLKHLPKEYSGTYKAALCAEYEVETIPRKAKFFFTKEAGGFKLHNIKAN